ncbi:MAG: hypothetical protein R2705_14540 [Ilumatobacteraceae bacterium]
MFGDRPRQARFRAGCELGRAHPIADLAGTLVVVIAGGGVPVAEGMWVGLTSRPSIQIDVSVRRIFHPADPSMTVGAVAGGELWMHPDVAPIAALTSLDVAAVREEATGAVQPDDQAQWDRLVELPTRPRQVVIIEDVVATGASALATHYALGNRHGFLPTTVYTPFIHMIGASCLAEHNVGVVSLVQLDRATSIDADALYRGLEGMGC